jgi:hypothetical protein
LLFKPSATSWASTRTATSSSQMDASMVIEECSASPRRWSSKSWKPFSGTKYSRCY